MNEAAGVSAATYRDVRQSAFEGALRALTRPALDPLFWRAERLGQPSAWWLHVPFAHWIVCAARPRVLIELGTRDGVSYAAFCQAVRRAGLPTRCHAVDTWRDDEQTGRSNDDVFQDLATYNSEQFGSFSTLIRGTFDEALDLVEDGSVGILHIDGLHTYAAVRRIYEDWLPKLSTSAVVLLHGVNVRTQESGAWRLWEELCTHHPSFTFLHGVGLGVLVAGETASADVLELCNVKDPYEIAAIRERFAWLGERWLTDTTARTPGRRVGEVAGQFGPTSTETTAELIALRDASQAAALEQEKLRAQLGEARRDLAIAQQTGTVAAFAQLEAARSEALLRSNVEAKIRDRSARRSAASRQGFQMARDDAARARKETEQLKGQLRQALERADLVERNAASAAEAVARADRRKQDALEQALAHIIKHLQDGKHPLAWQLPQTRRRAARALLMRANAERDAQRFGEAATLYERFLRSAPGNAGIQVQCGHMYKEAGNLEKAELHYLCAKALAPDDDDLALQLGHFYKVAGRAMEALASYERAVKLHPGWPQALAEIEALRANSAH